jgi:hypothetical protein
VLAENYVGTQRDKIVEICKKIFDELELLQFMLAGSLAGFSLGGEVEKTKNEKVLSVLLRLGLSSVREVCICIYPWAEMVSEDRKRALKSVSMCLLRLCGKKRQRAGAVSEEKLVWRFKTRKGLMYDINNEGRRKLEFYQQNRIRAGNNKILHKQMQKILALAETLVPEIEAMLKHNVQAAENLVYKVILEWLCKSSNTTVMSLTRQVVADQKEIIEGENYSRVDTFIQSMKKVIESATFAISASNYLLTACGVQKIVLENNERIRQIEKEDREYFDQKLKELEASMHNKKERVRKYFSKRVHGSGKRSNSR